MARMMTGHLGDEDDGSAGVPDRYGARELGAPDLLTSTRRAEITATRDRWLTT